MTTTPPPASRTRTPPTPLHGAKDDSFTPYPTRKSTRSSMRDTRTPPPPSLYVEQHTLASTTPPPTKRKSSGRVSKHTFSPPSSEHSSPRKAAKKSSRTMRTVLPQNSDDDGDASVSAGNLHETMIDESKLMPSLPRKNGLGSTVSTGMLPTPAKTPRKRPDQPASALKTTARVLFQDRPETVEEVMPSPRKRSKKQTGLSLGSFADELGQDEGDEIHIFTDSKERVPEADESTENPFYGKAGVSGRPPHGPKRSAKKRKSVEKPQEINESNMQEMMKRDDGMVYVFRGKKIFRKFDESDDELGEAESDGSLSGNLGAGDLNDGAQELSRPLTRSAIKPRLLFPTEQQRLTRSRKQTKPQPVIQAEVDDDEEALTDIDELTQNGSKHFDDCGDTSMIDAAGVPLPLSPTTPVDELASSTHASDPTSSTPFSGRKATPETSPADVEPDELGLPVPKRGKKVSPFDGWSRTKPGVGGKGKKRGGDVIERSGGVISKRTRSSGS
ncbi:MAG: hypothetical protein M4579_000633 [Chaenotheca gracillima]|nr:MAG: hypothetical protein M4579_000633 [Chaenotheca gracillima]